MPTTYHYFVSYCHNHRVHGSGYGNVGVTRPTPVETIEDVSDLGKAIGESQESAGTTVVILNYQLLRVESDQPESVVDLKADIEQVIADAESKIDIEHPEEFSPAVVANDLLWRLRVLTGLDIEAYSRSYAHPMIIGRTDVCRITTPHDVTFCGKHEAHR